MICNGTDADARALHAARANVYRILADCFLAPDQWEPGFLDFLPQDLEICAPELAAPAEELRLSVSGLAPAQTQALRIAHAKLFVGPFDLLAPPFGSVYLDGERMLMGPSTLDAQRHYARAGLSALAEQGGAPDHILVELEFMYFLTHQFVTTGDARHLSAAREFLTAHLGRFMPPFAARVQAHSPHPFYAPLAALCDQFVAGDASRC